MLTPDMRAVIQSAHLCFAATVTLDGRPSVSPKGTIRVWDDARLFCRDVASDVAAPECEGARSAPSPAVDEPRRQPTSTDDDP